MDRIISREEAAEIRSNVAAFQTAVYNTTNAAVKVIESFSNEKVVDSFFASGNYGQKEKELMEKILKGVNEYNEAISGADGLIVQTLKYLDTHTELVESGTASGSVSTSDTYGAGGGSPSKD